MEKLLLTGAEFTAVIAFNDMSGVGAIRKLKSAGFSIPGDVSIVGFDNVQLSQLVEPPLTTVSQPIENMARLATADVLTQIEKGEPPSNQRLLIEPELVVRGSTAPCIVRPPGHLRSARSV
jgi:LacI family transcriptional regulator